MKLGDLRLEDLQSHSSVSSLIAQLCKLFQYFIVKIDYHIFNLCLLNVLIQSLTQNTSFAYFSEQTSKEKANKLISYSESVTNLSILLEQYIFGRVPSSDSSLQIDEEIFAFDKMLVFCSPYHPAQLHANCLKTHRKKNGIRIIKIVGNGFSFNHSKIGTRINEKKTYWLSCRLDWLDICYGL